jgi:gamma-glutamylcyclotransferase (GGCT)/AIG2-like uncharacterized protein YtfP
VKYLVFVYGTLRKGGLRHPIVERCACLTAEATLQDFAMYNLGPFPAITGEAGESVKGEVYEVDEELLALLDRIEGYHEKNPNDSLYRRKRVKVNDSDGHAYRCFTYEIAPRFLAQLKQAGSFGKAKDPEKVESGDWFDVGDPI